MPIENLNGRFGTRVRRTLTLALALVGLAFATGSAQAGNPETMKAYCESYLESPASMAPEFMVVFDNQGAVKAAPGMGGTEVNFPPMGGTLTDILNFQYTYWTGSNWFCYKIAGVKKCFQY